MATTAASGSFSSSLTIFDPPESQEVSRSLPIQSVKIVQGGINSFVHRYFGDGESSKFTFNLKSTSTDLQKGIIEVEEAKISMSNSATSSDIDIQESYRQLQQIRSQIQWRIGKST